MKAQIRWNAGKQKYELVHKGKVLVSSKNEGHLKYVVDKQKSPAVIIAGVTEYEVVSAAPVPQFSITDESGRELPPSPKYTIEKRFSYMEQMIGMVINKTARSILVSGEGGVGKTYTVLRCLQNAGKVDYASVISTVEDLNVTPEDDEATIEEKAVAQINAQKGDYVIVKGRATAAALYRILYEHKSKIIIFDDCDSVLKDDSALNLLKSALDSYEDRWVNWRSEKITDLPQMFKFEGSVIFISNMPLSKVDEAVKTRCLKVDLSMTKAQRIERMRAVLPSVMPEIELDAKEDALNLLEENMHLTDDINFRTLMNMISIRIDPALENWRELATFALTEH